MSNETNKDGLEHYHIRFHIMNTMNTSTGFTPFQLQMGQSPWLIPPLVTPLPTSSEEETSVHEIIQKLQNNILEAQDNLLCAKFSQSVEANKHHSLTFPFVIGSCVQLMTLHQCNEYKAKGEKRVAKIMPCYDELYTIVDTDERHSTITLELPNVPNISQPFTSPKFFPSSRTTPCFSHHGNLRNLPQSWTQKENKKEFFIDKILDQCCHRHSYQYLVHWHRYGHEHNQWLPCSELQDYSTLDDWLVTRGE